MGQILLLIVVKHEAMAVRRGRLQLVGTEEADLDRAMSREVETPEEQVVSWERTTRTAEAMRRLKPQEARAMWLRAMGHSYQSICDETGWTYTKVNRCLAEGRKAFLARYAGIESGAECTRWAQVLSAMVDGEATAEQIAQARPHLRNCRACRATIRELHDSGPSLAAVFPAAGLPLIAAAGERPEASLILRVYEAVSTAVGERAALAALKLQAAVDAASATKVAAVAASAAAVAGGGAVAVERVAQRPAAAPKRVVAQPRPSPSRTRRPIAARAPTAAPVRRTPPPRDEHPTEFARAGASDSTTEFEPALARSARQPPVPTAPVSSERRRSSSTSPPANGGEFDP